MSNGEAANGASNGSQTHTQSQRYLSTRGDDNDVRTSWIATTPPPRSPH